MKIHVGGLHGSFPVSGPDHSSGGDTVSLLVESATGAQIILDAGTGLLKLLPLLRPGALLALTHFHLDHIQAIPLLVPSNLTAILSARSDASEILARVFSPPVWPVAATTAPFVAAAPGAPYFHRDLAVTFHPVVHPDNCWAIRIDEPSSGESLVLATDLEWSLTSPDARAAFAVFAHKTTHLFFDCHFLPEELPSHSGWGHSSWQEAAEAARLSAARFVHPIHLAPSCNAATASAIRNNLCTGKTDDSKGNDVVWM